MTTVQIEALCPVRVEVIEAAGSTTIGYELYETTYGCESFESPIPSQTGFFVVPAEANSQEKVDLVRQDVGWTVRQQKLSEPVDRLSWFVASEPTKREFERTIPAGTYRMVLIYLPLTPRCETDVWVGHTRACRYLSRPFQLKEPVTLITTGCWL